MACYRRSLLRELFFSRVIGLIIGVALCFCCITCKQKEAAAPAPTEPAQVRLGGEKRTNDVTRFNDSDDLESDFLNPPAYAQPRICWRWLEGNISKEGIRNDLTEMKKVGIRGAVIYDTDSSSYDQVERTKPGPGFMSQAWRDLFRYACEVADSLDMEISLNLGSRWHNGGPWITPELSSKKLVWSQIDVDGGRRIQTKLNLPEGLLTRPGSDELYYVPVAVLAVRLDEDNMYTAPLERFKNSNVLRSRPCTPFTIFPKSAGWAITGRPL
ncbi:glycosyl hydrolase [Tannerella forsythia]|uniref:glycosyl hydrolase n=1 Tax=Tannerella forsythia TaxID=28112 RepID=UPI0015CF3B05|nr:glycosyl hydrolase [Tannerella forsythia]